MIVVGKMSFSLLRKPLLEFIPIISVTGGMQEVIFAIFFMLLLCTI